MLFPGPDQYQRFSDNLERVISQHPDEVHGRNGRNKNNRRAARKTYSDLAYLMNYIQDKVQEEIANQPEPVDICRCENVACSPITSLSVEL